MSNVVQLFPKSQSEFVLTNEHINNYVQTMEDAHFMIDNLRVDDMKSVIRITHFYSKMMQKRIKELEGK